MHSGREEKETKERGKKNQIFAFNLTESFLTLNDTGLSLYQVTNARIYYSSGYCVY